MSCDRQPTHTPAALRGMARYQGWVEVCLLVQALSLVGSVVMLGAVLDDPRKLRWLLLGAMVLAVVSGAFGAVSVGRLAASQYGTAAGVLLAPPAAVPGLGFVVLLAVNVLAKGVLRRHGVRVGAFGANRADLAKLEAEYGGDRSDEDEGW